MLRKWYVYYRECNITGWHKKYFFTKDGAERFAEKIKAKKWEEVYVKKL